MVHVPSLIVCVLSDKQTEKWLWKSHTKQWKAAQQQINNVWITISVLFCTWLDHQILGGLERNNSVSSADFEVHLEDVTTNTKEMILRSCAGWCAVTHHCWVISRRRSSWPNQAALPHCIILLLYLVVKIAGCLLSMLLGSSIESSANNYFGFESFEFYYCYFSFPLGCVYNAGCELQINAVLHTWAMLDILRVFQFCSV